MLNVPIYKVTEDDLAVGRTAGQPLIWIQTSGLHLACEDYAFALWLEQLFISLSFVLTRSSLSLQPTAVSKGERKRMKNVIGPLGLRCSSSEMLGGILFTQTRWGISRPGLYSRHFLLHCFADASTIKPICLSCRAHVFNTCGLEVCGRLLFTILYKLISPLLTFCFCNGFYLSSSPSRSPNNFISHTHKWYGYTFFAVFTYFHTPSPSAVPVVF